MDNIRLTRDSNTRKMSMDNFSDSRSQNDFKINNPFNSKNNRSQNGLSQFNYNLVLSQLACFWIRL